MDDTLGCLAAADCTSFYPKKETAKFFTPLISLRMKDVRRDLRKSKGGFCWRLFGFL